MDKQYYFRTFPESGIPLSPSGQFRDNIRLLIDTCAQILEHGPFWCVPLRTEKSKVLPLYIVEEDVNGLCIHCSYADWGHHLVSKRKYHFVILGVDDWGNQINNELLDLQNHLLHGLIHCNGFGHLLCINGIEGGSKTLPGSQIMGLWDRMCTWLRTRKVNVVDTSIKENMNTRLLYGIACGESWFGRWDYKFLKGTFGVGELNYVTAISYLSSLKLDEFILDISQGDGDGDVGKIISHYRGISKKELITIRDLFRFLLNLKMRIPFERNALTITDQPIAKERSTECRKFNNVAAELPSQYPISRLQNVADVIVEVLKKNRSDNKVGSCGMTRQEAREAARLHIDDTGLIDHALKVMNNVIVGNYIVHRVVNPSTKLLEFYIRDLDSGVRDDLETLECGKTIHDNMICLYENVKLRYSESNNVNSAVQTILNSKHFVKQWEFMDEINDSLRFICRVKPDLSDLVLGPNEDFPPEEFSPGEYMVVSPSATVGELKVAIQNAMRDTYFVMERVIVTDILHKDSLDDKEVLSTVFLSIEDLRVRCSRLNWDTELRYEGGVKPSIVRCKCGATDDDGERMVSCGKCGDWHHTICVGIDSDKEEKKFFICDMCFGTLAQTHVDKYQSWGFPGEFFGVDILFFLHFFSLC